MSELCLCYGCMKQYKKEFGMCPFCGYENDKAAAEPLQLAPGTVLQNKYIVGRTLGYGGFSITYVGFDVALQIKVAIKEYMPSEYATRVPNCTQVTVSQQGDDGQHFLNGINKFVEEAQRIAGLDNIDGVVKVFDAFMENNTAYIVMEFLEGETIAEKLKKEGRMEPEKTFQMLMPLLDSLEKVHKAGILHRDISPDNIFYTQDDKIKLIDFGAARKMPKEKSRSLSVFIKPGYTPAEQYTTDGEQGTWTDVYSLAATIYKMITDITPPDGLQRKSKDSIKPPSKLGVKISRNAETAILNAMNVRVAKRTQTVDEFKKQLYSTKEVKRIMDKGGSQYLGGIPRWVKISGIIAAVLCVGVIGVAASGILQRDVSYTMGDYSIPEGKTLVPSFTSLTEKEANEKAVRNFLAIRCDDAQISEDIPAGKIFKQKPDVGTIVDKNTVIQLTKSSGRDLVLLPLVKYMTKEEAQKLLEDNDFRVKIVEQESVLEKGTVISTDLEQEMTYARSSEVVLYVSSGMKVDTTQKVTVPDFGSSKLTIEQAYELAKESGLELHIENVVRMDMKPDMVISQSIKKGEQVSKGTKVTLKVSREPERVKVPSLYTKTEAQAKKELDALHLKYKINYDYSDATDAGKVMEQSKSPESSVFVDTTIILTVSKGPQPRTAQTSATQQSAVQSSASQPVTQTSRVSQTSAQVSKPKTLSSMQIVSQPSKTKYRVGEKLSLNGMSVELRYSDGSSTRVTPSLAQSVNTSACQVVLSASEYANGLQTTGSRSFTVQCENFRADFTVQVIILQSISVTSPSKTSYTIGESFNSNGMAVRARYSDGTTETLSSGAYQLRGFDSNNLGQKTITISYQGKTAYFYVSVDYYIRGSCGGNGGTTYMLDKNGMLTITGQNTSMDDYKKADFQPWAGYRRYITGISLSNITKIGREAFHGCDLITSVTIPDTVSEIGENAFAGCTSLQKVNMRANLSKISYGLFNGCEKLETVSSIPDGVETIDEWAFGGCTAISSISIPKSVTTIGDAAFCDWESNQTIRFEGDPDTIKIHPGWGGNSARVLKSDGSEWKG